MKVKTIQGKYLAKEIVLQIDKIWTDTWGQGTGPEPKRIKFDKEYFFILQDADDQILSVACVNPVSLEYLGKKYLIGPF